ncbi:MAG: hypothetical protein DRJ03_08115 [Chloroflexi bacterium]|nr:MAG: hypothetical protein DRJ03_08115 [Chloroflexota bacterium]
MQSIIFIGKIRKRLVHKKNKRVFVYELTVPVQIGRALEQENLLYKDARITIEFPEKEAEKEKVIGERTL